MFRSLTMIAVAASLAVGVAHAQNIGDNIRKAVADSSRPAADTQRDADRKPAELVAFAGIKTGDKVADIAPGGGYFTRIFAKTVGPSGKVYGTLNEAQVKARPESAAGLNALAADANYGNVVAHVTNYEQMTFPEPLDVAWTSLNYHDFKNRGETYTAAMNKAIFAALKPGGTYIVIDHAAAAGSGGRDTSTLHRIDPELVKKEVVAAGFVLEGESAVLKHPADNHSERVFEGAIRGKTDQFVFKFKKPGA